MTVPPSSAGADRLWRVPTRAVVVIRPGAAAYYGCIPFASAASVPTMKGKQRLRTSNTTLDITWVGWVIRVSRRRLSLVIY